MVSPDMSDALTKRGRGGPPFMPSDEQRVLVERLIGMMMPERVIATSILDPPMSLPTFRKHFKMEIKLGRDRAKGRLRALLLRAAESGNVAAIIYLIARIDPEFHRQGIDSAPRAPMDPANPNGGGIHFYIPENGRDWDRDDDDG
jgi:hypothetical protein